MYIIYILRVIALLATVNSHTHATYLVMQLIWGGCKTDRQHIPHDVARVSEMVILCNID